MIQRVTCVILATRETELEQHCAYTLHIDSETDIVTTYQTLKTAIDQWLAEALSELN